MQTAWWSFETTWGFILEKGTKAADYMIAHPSNTTVFILFFICTFLTLACIGFYCQEGTIKVAYSHLTPGERNAATTELDTETAVLMIVTGLISLVVSVVAIVWYIYTANVDVIGFFQNNMGRY